MSNELPKIEPGDVVEVECPDNDNFCMMVTGLSENDTGIRVQDYRIRTSHSKRTPTKAVLAESLVVPIAAISKVWSGC